MNGDHSQREVAVPVVVGRRDINYELIRGVDKRKQRQASKTIFGGMKKGKKED